ncbi:MAG: extracellular solute-binding protein [Maricaulaceae bacterium]|nr:extracellular solute-binding protein [Maricaulaceae bacterium]
MRTRALSILVAFAAAAATACGQPGGGPDVVNVYSARHYDSDRYVYAAFTEATGIRVNLIEADGDLMIERIRADGARSPADVIVTVDAGRLYRAQAAGLFAQEHYGVIAPGVPEHLRDTDGYWVGFAKRARVIVYSRERADASQIANYADLADPRWAGRVCVRSSSNVYNQSLLAALVERMGEEAAEAWARGVANNLARPPQGGDTDQIRAVAAGECDVALVNHYYLARLANSAEAADRAVAASVGLIFPDQDGEGTHVNISGAGVAANAPNPEAARAFIAFLFTEDAQRAFAELTSEYPVLETVTWSNEPLAALGGFREDEMNVARLGERAETAQRIFDRAGWP